jgi:short subunit fatty acids transporter
MKTELDNNKITNGFITPNDYFDNLSDRIVEKINGEASSNLIPKTSGFSVPEDYFVKNEAKLLARVNFTEAKVISLKHTLYKVSGIAAILLLTIVSPMLYYSTETKNNELVEMSYLQLHSEELSVYEVGSMLDDKEIIELENELIYNNLNNIN